MDFSFSGKETVVEEILNFISRANSIYKNLYFNQLQLPLKNQKFYINHIKDNLVKNFLENEEIINFDSDQRDYDFFINHYYGNTYILFGIYQKFADIFQFMRLFETGIKIFNPDSAISHNQNHQNALITKTNYYEKLNLKELEIIFPGLFWLNYFSAERMAELGGEKLFELPYATKIERLNGGIFIQIGDSPEEALTPEGEERLYKATEWVYKLVRGEESPHVQIPEYFKVKPEHIQEIQLSAPVRKGQDTLIDLSIAVAWSEQKILLPKIKVTVTAVPQGSIGYYEFMVILPQEVTVEGVTYELDSETRFRVEG